MKGAGSAVEVLSKEVDVLAGLVLEKIQQAIRAIDAGASSAVIAKYEREVRSLEIVLAAAVAELERHKIAVFDAI